MTWQDASEDDVDTIFIVMGQASTLNTSARIGREGEEIPKNPIGFIWPKEVE